VCGPFGANIGNSGYNPQELFGHVVGNLVSMAAIWDQMTFLLSEAKPRLVAVLVSLKKFFILLLSRF